MKKFNVTVGCIGVYCSSIMVPDELTFEESIKYAKEHLGEIPYGEITWVEDSDLDEDNCDFEEEEE